MSWERVPELCHAGCASLHPWLTWDLSALHGAVLAPRCAASFGGAGAGVRLGGDRARLQDELPLAGTVQRAGGSCGTMPHKPLLGDMPEAQGGHMEQWWETILVVADASQAGLCGSDHGYKRGAKGSRRPALGGQR